MEGEGRHLVMVTTNQRRAATLHTRNHHAITASSCSDRTAVAAVATVALQEALVSSSRSRA